MAESMIERVARAISRSQVETERMWQSFLPEASAAIEAMREPTDGMKKAWLLDADDWVSEKIEDPYHPYKVMLDAALKEQP